MPVKVNSFEFFETPPDLSKFMSMLGCLSYIQYNRSWPKMIYDPCAGHGALGKGFREYAKNVDNYNPTVIGTEIQDVWSVVEPLVSNLTYNAIYCGEDYLKRTVQEEADLMLMNPPFSKAQDFINHAYDSLKTNGVLVALLPVNFWFSEKRLNNERWSPFACYTLFPRPSFIGKGTRKESEYVLNVYGKWCDTAQTILKRINWRD